MNSPIIQSVKLLVSHKKDFHRFLKKELVIKPKKIQLYEIAFLHRSASIDFGNGIHINNERLEYLGDAVLDAIIADYLFKKFPSRNEGFLTQLRSKIVKRSSLENIASKMGIDRVMVVHSHSEVINKRILGNAFEALIGAIYLDKGYDKTKKYVIHHVIKHYVSINELLETENDYKSRLIEKAQKNKIVLSFESSDTTMGKRPIPMFHSKILHGERIIGEGIGKSKKESEQNASEIALAKLSKILDGK